MVCFYKLVSEDNKEYAISPSVISGILTEINYDYRKLEESSITLHGDLVYFSSLASLPFYPEHYIWVKNYEIED